MGDDYSVGSLGVFTTRELKVLSQLELSTARDILSYRPIQTARLIVAAVKGNRGLEGIQDLFRDELPGRDYGDSPAWSVATLREVAPGDAKLLARLGVRTIADLADFPGYGRIQSDVGSEPSGSAVGAANAECAHEPFCERPSAPQELMPELIGAVSSSVRFSSFIHEEDLPGLRTRLPTECGNDIGFRSLNWHDANLKEVQGDPVVHILTSLECPVVRIGYIAAHHQTWTHLGAALGEVIHSLSLAPGESRNIAMIDWRRRQQTARQEETGVSERLGHFESHNRALDEVATAVALEHQFGQTITAANTMVTAGAFVAAGAAVGGIAGGTIGTLVEPGGGTLIGAGLGAAAGVAAGGLVFSGANAIGMIQSESSGERDLVAEMHQRINQSTQQQSSSVRSLWSTVVVEDAQDEVVAVRSTNVTNYNHMHALNVQYYELLHHYLTTVTLEGIEPILLLPFSALSSFSDEVVEHFWPSLRVGLDQALRTKGDAVFTQREPDEPQAPEGTRPDAPADLDEYRIASFQAEAVIPVAGDFLSVLEKILKTVTNAATLTPEVIDDLTKSAKLELHFSDQSSVEINGQRSVLGELATAIAAFVSGQDVGSVGVRFRFLAPVNKPAAKLTGLTFTLFSIPALSWDEALFRWLLDDGINFDLDITSYTISHPDGALSGANIALADNDELEFVTVGKAERDLTWSPLADQFGDWARYEEDNAPWAEYDKAHENWEEELERRANWREDVIDAINRERFRFTRLLLANGDPGYISRVLDLLELGGPGDGDARVKLHRVAYTTPVGFTDNAVLLKLKYLHVFDKSFDSQDLFVRTFHSVFQSSGSIVPALPALIRYPISLAKRFGENREELARSTHIYLPGSGLFAEAVLGRSNSAEYLDIRRYWNWVDSPIPHQAAAIRPLSAQSYAQAQGNVAPTVPTSTLDQVGPVAMPDPTGMAGILQAIQNPNMFRDMSKSDQLVSIMGSLSELASEMGRSAAELTGQAASDTLASATDIGKVVADLAKEYLAANVKLRQVARSPANHTQQAGTAEYMKETLPENANDMTPGDIAAGDSVGVPVGGGSPGDSDVAPDDLVHYTAPESSSAVPGYKPSPSGVIADARIDAELSDPPVDFDAIKESLLSWFEDGVQQRISVSGQNLGNLEQATAEYWDWLEKVHQAGLEGDGDLQTMSGRAQDEMCASTQSLFTQALAAVSSLDELESSTGIPRLLDLATTNCRGDEATNLAAQIPVSCEVVDITAPTLVDAGNSFEVSFKIGVKYGNDTTVHFDRGYRAGVSCRQSNEKFVGLEPDFNGLYRARFTLPAFRPDASIAEEGDFNDGYDVYVRISPSALCGAAHEIRIPTKFELLALGGVAEDDPEIIVPRMDLHISHGSEALLTFRARKGVFWFQQHQAFDQYPVKFMLEGPGSLNLTQASPDAQGVVGVTYTAPDSGSNLATIVAEITDGVSTGRAAIWVKSG